MDCLLSQTIIQFWIGNPCNRSQCLENGHPQGRYRLRRKAAARLRSKATGPQGDETDPSTPVACPHLCVQLQDVFSPTTSKSSLSLAMDYHDQKVKYSEQKVNKKKNIIQKNLRTQNFDFECHCFPLQFDNCFTRI